MYRETEMKSYIALCPACNRIHRFEDEYVDEIVDCECGYSFYMFAFGEMRIVIPEDEAMCDSVARTMRRFVVSTGRCGNIPPELYVDQDGQTRLDMTAQELDTEEELTRILDEYQTENFGRCYVTKDIVDSICDSMNNGKDIELKKQKDSVDVIELKKKRVSTHKQGSRRLSEYTQLTADLLKNGGLFRINQ